MSQLGAELEKLKRQILYLGGLAEESVRKSGMAIKTLNIELAQEVIDHDEQIDALEVEIEEDCLRMLALYQPVANDLRFVVSVLKINNDLERIGDLAVNIAERVAFLQSQPRVPIPFDFDNMWKISLDMLKRSLDALVQLDVNAAKKVCDDDDLVDALNRDMYSRVTRGLHENSEHAESLVHYLSVSRHLERVADYATNIAEDVIYMIEGKIVRHQPEDYSHLYPAFSKLPFTFS